MPAGDIMIRNGWKSIMVNLQELAWLHDLQGDLALRRDWVAVGHIQALIDRLADEHGFLCEQPGSAIPRAMMQ
jgi:hypothetical protein